MTQRKRGEEWETGGGTMRSSRVNMLKSDSEEALAANWRRQHTRWVIRASVALQEQEDHSRTIK